MIRRPAFAGHGLWSFDFKKAAERLVALPAHGLRLLGARASSRMVAMTYDPSTRTTAELFRDWSAAMRELRRRGIVAAPELETIPERRDTHTAAGKPTTGKLNKSERNDEHADAIAQRTAGAAHLAAQLLDPSTRGTVAAVTATGDVPLEYDTTARHLTGSVASVLGGEMATMINRKGAAAAVTTAPGSTLSSEQRDAGARLASGAPTRRHS